MVLMALRAMTAHILSQICAVVFTSPLTSRLCSQLQELQELPTSPLRMWSSSKKHQLILTLAPGPGVEPGSRGHEADALPLSYPHILHGRTVWYAGYSGGHSSVYSDEGRAKFSAQGSGIGEKRDFGVVSFFLVCVCL